MAVDHDRLVGVVSVGHRRRRPLDDHDLRLHVQAAVVAREPPRHLDRERHEHRPHEDEARQPPTEGRDAAAMRPDGEDGGEGRGEQVGTDGDLPPLPIERDRRSEGGHEGEER